MRIMVASLAVAVVLVGGGGGLYLTGQIGRIEIAVAPPNAAAEATLELTKGQGFFRDTGLIALLWGALEVRAAAPGFAPEIVSIPDAARQRGHLDIVLRELPARLQATTEPERAGTKWFLDGALAAEGPRLTLNELPAGAYTVTARHPFHAPASQSLKAERGGTHLLTLNLVPVEGRITIDSDPAGATVRMDGNPVGETPVTFDAEGGEHALEIALRDHDPRTDTVAITHDAPEVERRYKLFRTPGRVSFALSPQGGSLSINGQPVQSPENLLIPAGVPQRARYAKRGYVPRELGFTLEPVVHRTIPLTLDPIVGVVDIESTPAADIEIDGQVVGRTPKSVELPVVTQTITLRSKGYETLVRTVTPRESVPQKVVVELRSLAAARFATAPPDYENPAGIKLQLFKTPGTFTLGAPRGEPGRRANEFERRVHLAKAFYAGVYEITVEQYRRFTHPKAQPPASGRDRPVTGVEWSDAARYCNWLSQQENLTPVYTFDANGGHAGSNPAADGYRLLTEAEWEWLARRAGRRTAARFPWGDDEVVPAEGGNLADESAQGKVPVYIPGYNDNFPELADVGEFPANASTLHDLAGNVSEWVHDNYSLRPPSDPSAVATDPFDTGPGSWHTVKGSSWRSGTLSELRASWRDGHKAARDDLGFRVARYLIGES